MMTNPPPYDSAPTLNATQAIDSSTPPPNPVAARTGSAGTGRPDLLVTSMSPQPRRTSTSHGPRIAAARPPAIRYSTQRSRLARAQLAGMRLAAACTATAATAAPAPAPAALTHTGGEAARNGTDSARMRIR